MAKKKDTNIPLSDDTDSDFSEDRDFLTYKPKIDFVEPEKSTYQNAYKNADELQAALEAEAALETEVSDKEIPSSHAGLGASSFGTETPELKKLFKDLGEREKARLQEQLKDGVLDDLRDRTEKLANGLDAVTKLAELTQQRIDQRVNAAGGAVVKLDPRKDAVTIAAMKRRFPDKVDPTQITYEDYKQALDCVQEHAPAKDNLPMVTEKDIKDARSDPNRVNFGGSNNTQGENRPELSSPANNLDPIDLNKFQKSAVAALFALMLPLIAAQDKLSITQHLITTPHKPI